MRHLMKIGKMSPGKKILLPLLSAFVCGTEAHHAKLDGFYAGGSVGYLNQSTHLHAQQNPMNQNADMNNTTAGKGVPIAEVVLGWGKVFLAGFYGGVEGKVDWAMGGRKKVAEDTNFIYKAGRKGLGLGVLARLGYAIAPTTLIYGGIGIKSVDFAYDLFEKEDQISAPFSKRSLNFLTEAGIEASSSCLQNLAFRFSYSFMPRQTVIEKTTNFPVNHMYREQGIFKAGVAEHSVKGGIVYRF